MGMSASSYVHIDEETAMTHFIDKHAPSLRFRNADAADCDLVLHLWQNSARRLHAELGRLIEAMDAKETERVA